ncbi:hypothetical protein RRG08_035435 [Elysia crispata]|uniref:Uncharacterized protein n=1 Tax=Elysia crispata TaxID=231223 RepID=A0AAE1CRZ7_9GAST|nr:hypothetical protein RRG08_035435 [Elysia crispata]
MTYTLSLISFFPTRPSLLDKILRMSPDRCVLRQRLYQPISASPRGSIPLGASLWRLSPLLENSRDKILAIHLSDTDSCPHDSLTFALSEL